MLSCELACVCSGALRLGRPLHLVTQIQYGLRSIIVINVLVTIYPTSFSTQFHQTFPCEFERRRKQRRSGFNTKRDDTYFFFNVNKKIHMSEKVKIAGAIKRPGPFLLSLIFLFMCVTVK